MRARFDGICIKCGLAIKGFMNHPDLPDDIAWTRKPRFDGLRTAAWHTACSPLPDNAEVVARLLARQGGRVTAPSVTMPVVETVSAPLTVAVEPASNNDALMAQLAALLPQLGIAVPSPEVKKTTAHVKPSMPSINERSKWWEVLEACLHIGLTRVLLVGPPGTGKSTTADRDGLRVTCHEDAGPESMVGTFIQKDGNTVWIDGPAVCAMRSGSRIVLDETDHSSPECVSLLYALLDDSPSIVLPTGDNVKAKAGYQVIGTSNSNPGDFPEAILDRFEAVIIASEPHPNALIGVRKDAGENADKLLGVMTNYYRSLDKKGYEFAAQPTLRK